MEKAIADDVSTADVLWYAAERIGKSSSGDEIQRICDYLVNKNWFQTAGDLRIAMLATEEWHSLQIPSRLKIAVQQVLDEVQYPQQEQQQGYADYYYAAQGENHQASDYDNSVVWAASGSSGDGAPAAYEGYEGYYYSQEAAAPPAAATDAQYAQYQEGSCDYAAAANGESSAAAEGGEAEYEYAKAYIQAHRADLYASSYYSQSNTPSTDSVQDQTLSESYYYQHHQPAQGEAYETEDSEVVEAHAVDVEDATTYEEILAPMAAPPRQWGCRQCTFLNPVSESFCEMCHDHISSSPDMAAIAFASIPAPAAPTVPQAQHSGCEPEYAPPGYAGRRIEISTQAMSPPMSPLYSPSAPSYEEAMDCDDDNGESSSQPRATLVMPPAPIAAASSLGMLSEVAKQLAFQQSGECEIIHPTKVFSQQQEQERYPPPPPATGAENYLALAFKGRTSLPGGGGAAAGHAVAATRGKSDQVRREEDALTEYSF